MSQDQDVIASSGLSDELGLSTESKALGMFQCDMALIDNSLISHTGSFSLFDCNHVFVFLVQGALLCCSVHVRCLHAQRVDHFK